MSEHTYSVDPEGRLFVNGRWVARIEVEDSAPGHVRARQTVRLRGLHMRDDFESRVQRRAEAPAAYEARVAEAEAVTLTHSTGQVDLDEWEAANTAEAQRLA